MKKINHRKLKELRNRAQAPVLQGSWSMIHQARFGFVFFLRTESTLEVVWGSRSSAWGMAVL